MQVYVTVQYACNRDRADYLVFIAFRIINLLLHYYFILVLLKRSMNRLGYQTLLLQSGRPTPVDLVKIDRPIISDVPGPPFI